MRRSLILACTVVALSFASLEGEARADDAAVAEAQARFNEGLQLADAGKNEEARLKFTQAVAVLKAPAVLFNLARVEQLTGHEMEALAHYKQFLKAAETDPKVTDAMREKTRGYIAELSKKAGQIDIDAPPDARVSIDGKPLEAPATEPVHVAPGRHVVEAAFQGKVKSVAVDCTAGNVSKARLDFENGGTEPPREEEKKTWSTGKVVTVAALGAGAVAGGVLFFVFRGQAQSNVEDAQAVLKGSGCVGVTGDSRCDQAATLKNDRDSNQTISNVALIGGITLAAGALGTAFLWPNAKKEQAARATPVVGPGFAGMTLGGSF